VPDRKQTPRKRKKIADWIASIDMVGKVQFDAGIVNKEGRNEPKGPLNRRAVGRGRDNCHHRDGHGVG
jgi:hypothetical protein